jgi:hypothetical protein
VAGCRECGYEPSGSIKYGEFLRWLHDLASQERLCSTQFEPPNRYSKNSDSSVGIALGYGLDDRGSRVRFPAGLEFFTSPPHPERFWGPPSLLSNA